MKPIEVRFSHWFPKLLGAGATTLGHTIYFVMEKNQVDPILFKHECIHVKQVEQAGSLFLFLWVYFFQWIRGGFKYHEIAYEKQAYHLESQPFDVDEAREWNRHFT